MRCAWRSSADARGVVAVLAGAVHSALDLRKTHTYRLDAFGSGDAGALAQIEEGVLRQHRPWPSGTAPAHGRAAAGDPAQWPQVEIVTSHAGADGRLVQALRRQRRVTGIVVAGTGNGTLHHELEAALRRSAGGGRGGAAQLAAASTAACSVRATARLPAAGALTPVQARIELMLRLLRA